MSNVVGPIDLLDWKTMRGLVQDIKMMKQRDPVRFSKAIKKETEILKYFKDLYQ